MIPQEFINEYNVLQYVHNGWVYLEITKGMYGLKQSRKLANDLLTEQLAAHGYYQCATTADLWRHKWQSILFVLIVDDFGIEYVDTKDSEHLLLALRSHYEITVDWTGTKFSGIDIEWDYNKRTCCTTMNGYINPIQLRYKNTTPTKPEHSPYLHRELMYGAKEQYATNDIDTTPPLDAAGIKWCQGVIGALLFYARAVDNKLLMTISAIGASQASATENTRDEINKLLNFCATYPLDGITYRASDMVLAAHSDASFLSKSKSRSQELVVTSSYPRTSQFPVIIAPLPRLVIHVFRNLFFGLKKTFLPGFLRIFFSCVSGGIFHRNVFLERLQEFLFFPAVT